MFACHTNPPTFRRLNRRSLSASLLLLIAVVPVAVAPASAAPVMPHHAPQSGNTEHPTQLGTPTDATTSTTPSNTTIVEAAPAMLYASGTTTTMYRWYSSGTSFGRYASHWTVPSGYTASRVGNRIVSGDFNGDGTDDIATAYDYGTYFRFHVWLDGVTYRSTWYEGSLNLDNVQGRLVAGDWDGDGRDDLALGYDYGTNTARIYRYRSNGSAFSHMAGDWVSNDGAYAFSRVSDRMVSGDFNNDGLDDIATAYSYSGPSYRFHVWLDGVTYRSTWYEGSLNLDNVQGRLVAGDWDGDGRDDLALGYDYGTNTARIYRYRSNGSAFSHMAGDWVSSDGGYGWIRVGDRMAAGDVNGDGLDDIAAAYSYTDLSRFHVWISGTSYRSNWYESSTFNLDNVQGRFVLGRW